MKHILIAAAEGEKVRIARLVAESGFTKVKDIRIGGATRAESVRACLSGIDKDSRIVMVHDGARPLVCQEDLTRIHDYVEESHQGAVLGIPLSDTLHQVKDNMNINNTVARSKCWRAQTPQVFPRGVLLGAYAAYDGMRTATDDASLVLAIGGQVRVLRGNRENIKITDPIDLKLAEVIWKERQQS